MHRRDFLDLSMRSLPLAFPSICFGVDALALGLEAESRLKITDLETFVISNPEPLKGGSHFVVLKLRTNQGLVGYGEASVVIRRERPILELINDLAEAFVIGSNPFDIENLLNTLYRTDYGLQHPDLMRLPIISAFEIACWDIVGKALDQPIYNLLGGKCRDRIRTYTYMFGYTTGRGFSLRQAAENAAYYLEEGLTAIGLDPAGPPRKRPRSLSLEELREAEQSVRTIREVVGDKCDILLKAHGQMTTHSAIRLAKRLEPFDPLWLEEPVPPENVEEMARVAQMTSIPIATGERLTTKYEFHEVLDRQAAQVLNLAVGRVGGILEGKKIAALAETRYAQIAPWMSTGPIAAAASLQLDVCCQNFLIQEGIEKWDGFHARCLRNPPRWENGYVIPPSGPGLGVELDEEFASKHPYKAPG